MVRPHDAALGASGPQADPVPAVPDAGALADRRAPGRGELTPERRGDPRRAMDRRVMALIEGMSDAFIALGPDWRVTYANAEAARLNDTTADRLVGSDHWVRWPHTVGSPALGRA